MKNRMAVAAASALLPLAANAQPLTPTPGFCIGAEGGLSWLLNTKGIAGLEHDPDSYFWLLIELVVLAEREGRPQPHTWFIRFCAGLMDEEDCL